MPGATLSKAASSALSKAKKERRFMEIVKNSSVPYKSVKKMYEGKYVDSQLVEKVETVLVAPVKKERPTPERIETVVCATYGISRETIRTSNAPMVVEAKQVCCYLMNKESGKSSPVVARYFGYSDHTGALNAIRKISDGIAVNKDLNAVVQAIKAKL